MVFSANYRGQYKFDKPSLLSDIYWFNTFLYYLLAVKKGDKLENRKALNNWYHVVSVGLDWS